MNSNIAPRLTLLAAIVAVAILGIGTACGAPAAGGLVGGSAGDEAPEFTLLLYDESTVSSADGVREGQPVFLFFTATW